ncbi:MAG: hypothetical protein AB1467_06710 [Candidatus Diapherotrites archaeon]
MTLIEAFENRLKEDEFDVLKAYQEAGITIKPEEIFQLGNHRLMCGNAAIKENVM